MGALVRPKYNPFRPNNIITPGMFKGRGPEIDRLERCLYQTKLSNPTHFLIQGERGIGKSSLFFLLEHLAAGKIPTIGEDRLSFVVVAVDLGTAGTELDVIREIAKGIRTAMASVDELKQRAKDFWDWLSKWEVLGVRYHGGATSTETMDALDELVSRVGQLCESLAGYRDGLLLLVDEADRPGGTANLGAICKLMTERLTRQGCSRVLLGLAGLPSLIGQLKASHESAPRLFTTMLLEPLLDDEVREVIKSALKEANSKNERQTTIAEAAIQLLVSLSEGYPHFIQQFCFSAFDADTDDNISVDDVLNGAYEENGALWQLGDKYFNEMYNLKIASDNYRTVLDTMAQVGDEWIARKDIIKNSGLPPSQVTNALNAMKSRDIILSDESRKNKGYYRLPTRSFAAWINAYSEVRQQKAASDEEVSTPK